MARLPKLEYDRGTLTLHPPPRGKDWLDFATWDDRIEKFRIPAYHYRRLVQTLNQAPTEFIDASQTFTPLELKANLSLTPYPHQTAALTAWKQGDRQGVVVLPTAAGKTYLAQLAIESTPRSTLILVPTLDLMHQWLNKLRQRHLMHFYNLRYHYRQAYL